MLKFGIKTVFLSSAVYYTIDKGVWKDSATTTALYEDLERNISPYVGELKKQIPYKLPALPSNDRFSYLFKHYWNTGVKTTFRFLIDLPTYTSSAASRGYELVISTLEAEQKGTTDSQKVIEKQ